MPASTSEGTGNGSVENVFPKILNGQVNINNLTDNTANVNSANLSENFDLDVEGINNDEWFNVEGFELELPSAGTYLIIYHITSLMSVSSSTDTIFMSSRLVKRIDEESIAITNGNAVVNYVISPVTSENYVNCHTHVLPYIASGNDVLSIDALWHGSNFSNKMFMGNGEGSYDFYGHSYISYYKIGN